MTNREEDELLSQQEVVVVVAGSDENSPDVDALNNVEIATTVNGSIELDSGLTNGSNEAAAATQNGTNTTISSITTEEIVVAEEPETNGIITEIHWNENPPSSASPSSGFSDDDSLTGAHEGDSKTIEQIVDMVRGMGRKGLLKEYAEIRARQPDGTFDHAKLRSNLIKNRYTDVLCYDHSRVVLSHDPTDDDPTNDYINANFVDGYKQKNAYISTQGEHSMSFKS